MSNEQKNVEVAKDFLSSSQRLENLFPGFSFTYAAVACSLSPFMAKLDDVLNHDWNLQVFHERSRNFNCDRYRSNVARFSFHIHGCRRHVLNYLRFRMKFIPNFP